MTAHAVRLFRRARRSLQIRLAAPFTDISEQANAPEMSFFDAATRQRNCDAHLGSLFRRADRAPYMKNKILPTLKRKPV